ncbi:MAG: M3 family metallopeptidase [Bacteroidales bacterium]|nr:M3 family metallopeptidase [Candidatus Liminaster caballi]
MKKTALLLMTTLTLASCQQNSRVNPLLEESNAPYGITRYTEIIPSDYREAAHVAMERQKAVVAAIVADADAPTFANTIAPLDRSNLELTNVLEVYFTLLESNANDSLQALETELSPLLSAHSDDIMLNQQLFDRVRRVYDDQHPEVADVERRELLTHEQMTVLEHIYKDFVRAGAALSDEQQSELRQLNQQISALQVQFGQNLLHETNNTFVTVDSRDELQGLPEANIEAAAQMAKAQGQEGKYMFNMQRPSCNPVLQYCSNRELRRRVYDAYYNRGNQGNEWDNREICRQLVELRLKKARLMGYDNCAQQILERRMAQTPQKAYDLMNAVWAPAVAKAQEELADIRVEMRKDGIKSEPEGWDYMYYSSRAKAAKFNIDEEKISEYFEIHNILEDGIFYVANRLYGLTFREITADVPAYEPTAQAWEVSDSDGKVVAIFYSDYYPRDGKGAGAWCTNLREQSYETDAEGNEVRRIPVLVNVCNMTSATANRPALQNADNVETMFHEFGHALHFMLHDVHYDAVSQVETDFVELPSQINEHWAFEPEVLAHYAKHYQTGEVIPAELVQKLEDSGKYGQGFATVEFLAAALVDMDLHTLTSIPENFDVMQFEAEQLAKRGIPSQILPRYRVTNFSHCMGGGYTAGYYCYLWSEVLDSDGFEAFKETGDIFNPEMARRFHDYILVPGSIDDGMTMYKNFRGAEPDIAALLRNRGLSASACR